MNIIFKIVKNLKKSIVCIKGDSIYTRLHAKLFEIHSVIK